MTRNNSKELLRSLKIMYDSCIINHLGNIRPMRHVSAQTKADKTWSCFSMKPARDKKRPQIHIPQTNSSSRNLGGGGTKNIM